MGGDLPYTTSPARHAGVVSKIVILVLNLPSVIGPLEFCSLSVLFIPFSSEIVALSRPVESECCSLCLVYCLLYRSCLSGSVVRENYLGQPVRLPEGTVEIFQVASTRLRCTLILSLASFGWDDVHRAGYDLRRCEHAHTPCE